MCTDCTRLWVLSS